MTVASAFFLVSLVTTQARAQKLAAHLTGTQAWTELGAYVSGGSDCDGDGVEDLAVAAPSDPSHYDPVVYVYSGATHAILGSFTGSWSVGFGHVALLVHDLDGDGRGDVVISSPAYWQPGANDVSGSVAAFDAVTGAVIWSITGAVGDGIGLAMASAGDLDQDGVDDIVVSGRNSFGGNGTVRAVSGRSGATIHVWDKLESYYGNPVSGNVDVDGDGTPDVIIGTPGASDSQKGLTFCGGVTVWSGATYGLLWSVLGDVSGEQLGFSVCGVTDARGIGSPIVLAGGPFPGNGGTIAGLAREFDESGHWLADLVGVAGDSYGNSICAIPDVDGDGLPEFAVGAPEPFLANDKGHVEIRKGSDATLLWDMTPPDDDSLEEYGLLIAGGDFNGDGRGDLVVGSPFSLVNSDAFAGTAEIWLMIPAQATNYGSGYAGTLGVPQLAALGRPGIGQTITVNVDNSLGSVTAGLLLQGASRQDVVTTAGGELLVVPALIVPLTVPVQGLQFSATLPDDLALLDVTIDLQVLELDPGAAHKISFTPGLELRIGVDFP